MKDKASQSMSLRCSASIAADTEGEAPPRSEPDLVPQAAGDTVVDKASQSMSLRCSASITADTEGEASPSEPVLVPQAVGDGVERTPWA